MLPRIVYDDILKYNGRLELWVGLVLVSADNFQHFGDGELIRCVKGNHRFFKLCSGTYSSRTILVRNSLLYTVAWLK